MADFKPYQDGTVRWRCCECSATITIKDDQVYKNQNETHKSTECIEMLPVQMECIREYEYLKYLAKTLDDFKFAEQYKHCLNRLQPKLDNRDIAEFWIKESSAKNCCSKIRSKRKKTEPKSTDKLTFTEQQKFITINNKQEPFLRYDNEDKNGNRIAVFYSNTILLVYFYCLLKPD